MKPFLSSLLVALLCQQAIAQDKMSVVSLFKNNSEGQRSALVMANQNYRHQPTLKNTLRDADSMAVALRYLGFAVTVVKDKNWADTKDAIDRFVNSLRQGDVAFVYYSGHGMGYLRDNYLLPTEFIIENDEQIRNRSISTTALRDDIARRNVRNLFLVVDACRNELSAAKGEGAYQLVPPENNPQGTIMAFATDYGATATYRSRQNKNSLYTESLLLYLRQPLEVTEIFRKANNRTFAESQRLGQPTQRPHYIPMIYDDYYFLRAATPAKPPKPTYLDLPFMEMVSVPGGTFDMGSTEGEANEKPVHAVTISGFYMGKYEVTVSQFAQFVAATNYQTDAEKNNSSQLWNLKTNIHADSTGINWRHDALGNRRPASEYNHPVMHVSHNDAVAFCVWLSKRDGITYRLPTEAQWEYAAGNGISHTKYSWGNGDPTASAGGNVIDESFQKYFTSTNWNRFNGYTDGYATTAPVGSFAPNTFGLHDMTGNVYEWCADWYGSDYYANSTPANPTGPGTGGNRVSRGGSWYGNPKACRLAFRYLDYPTFRGNKVGFRVISPAQ